MARITVEDCLDKVDNRFELVMVSSKRARQLQIGGKDPMVSVDNDKPTVIALREIADGMVDASILVEKPTVDIEDAGEQLEESVAAAAEATAEANAEAESGTDSETMAPEQEEQPPAED